MVQDEFNNDVNNVIGIYEDDLIDNYLVDQGVGTLEVQMVRMFTY